MNPDRLVAGLDIGSAKTTAIIGEVVGDLPKHPSVKVLGVGQARTTGMRRGVVSDIEETTRSIRKALQDAERMAGSQVQELYAGIAGEHVQAMTSKGIVAVSGDEIRKQDVHRANVRFHSSGSCPTLFRRSTPPIAPPAFAIPSG